MGILKLENNQIPLSIDPRFLKEFISADTKKTYSIALNHFFEYITEYFTAVSCTSKIKRNHIVEYRDYITEFCGTNGDTMAPKSVNMKLSAISSYFEFLVTEGLIKANPVKSVKRPKWGPKPKRAIFHFSFKIR